MPLANLFASTETDATAHSWSKHVHDEGATTKDELARVVAEMVVAYRCVGCPKHFNSWRECAERGVPLSRAAEISLNALLEPAFGLPGRAKPSHHVEGIVAEHLWYFLAQEMTADGLPEFVAGPGFRATDAGGDGLVLHRRPDGTLLFRLWEIKKCTGGAAVSATVRTAYHQLNSRALQYLAEYTTIAAHEAGDVALFLGEVIELWADADPAAAAGIAVCTSTNKVPRKCFGTIANHFKEFRVPKRLRGMLLAVDDFPDFAERVKRAVWKGL